MFEWSQRFSLTQRNRYGIAMHILPETPLGSAELASVRSKRITEKHSFLIAINYVSRSIRELLNHCRACETLAQVMQVSLNFQTEMHC
ncbi:Glycine--tRNA ligase beta subunit [Trichinella spiralis]|uniref:Glycine--tRNA ligase beta subunit n=1 Tax=Trichinella spiralis TaxID=6334 RepID=A0ABR3K2Z9_TRISP